jgi:esterase/lipase
LQVNEGATYSEALRIAREIKDLDGPNVDPACRTRLYTHGERTKRSLLLLHGFTSCPQQMDPLGRLFFERGWNVFVPRYPRHGYSDRLTAKIAELRPEQLIALANRAADVGGGLGERLTVAGLSLGAVLAGHLAQTRDGVERAVLVAPMLGLKRIPSPVLDAAAAVAGRAPSLYWWKDRALKERRGPQHSYPRYSSRAFAAVVEVGRTLTSAAERAGPKSGSIAVVTNAAEPQVDNAHARRLVEAWRAHGAAVQTYEFAASETLPHDLIDPAGAIGRRTEHVYPIVTRLIEPI